MILVTGGLGMIGAHTARAASSTSRRVAKRPPGCWSNSSHSRVAESLSARALSKQSATLPMLARAA